MYTTSLVDTMFSSKLIEVDENALEEVYRRFNRTEKSLAEDVSVIKKWMASQPHLPEVLDDNPIRNFLIASKCSIERAKSRIDMYYTRRTEIPDFHDSVNPRRANMRETMEIAAWVLLPRTTADLYRVTLFKVRRKDMIDRMQPASVTGLFTNFQEIRLREDVMLGDVSIFDMDGVDCGYLAKLTPAVLVKIFTIYEKVYSAPLKAVYVLNSPPFVTTVMAVLKKIMKPKLFQRICLCKDTTVLTETFPKEILPKDYGGEEKSVEELQQLLKIKLDEYQDRFEKLDRMKVNEDLRPEKLENHEVLGFHGNFKKLSFD